jgi:hypothetical protein
MSSLAILQKDWFLPNDLHFAPTHHNFRLHLSARGRREVVTVPPVAAVNAQGKSGARGLGETFRPQMSVRVIWRREKRLQKYISNNIYTLITVVRRASSSVLMTSSLSSSSSSDVPMVNLVAAATAANEVGSSIWRTLRWISVM